MSRDHYCLSPMKARADAGEMVEAGGLPSVFSSTPCCLELNIRAATPHTREKVTE